MMVFDIFCILMHQNIEKMLHNNSIQNVSISCLIKSSRSPGQQKALKIHIFVMHFDMLIKVGFYVSCPRILCFIVFCVSLPFFVQMANKKFALIFRQQLTI